MDGIKDYIELPLPKEAADTYYMNKSKSQIANFIFLDPDWYLQIFDPNTFYILGSKGSGKTLYAAYMCADIRNHTISKSHTIDVSDYGKLISMKTNHHLDFTDYLTMWKVVLLQKFLFGIESKELAFWGRTKNYEEIKETISQYFGYDVTSDSFNPITIIDKQKKQQEVTKYLKGQFENDIIPQSAINGHIAVQANKQLETVQLQADSIETHALEYTDTWMRAIDAFRKTFEHMSFGFNHYLFIDGLDVRPQNIDAQEYSECIGALIRAVYEINTKILGNLKKRDEHDFKIIALTRTDIFLNSNLVNVTSCINDNCVELDWTYNNESEFVYSNLYKMMNRVLGWNGESSDFPLEKYFGFNFYPSRRNQQRPITAAMYIQRNSRLRPRDIVVMLHLIQRECKKRNIRNPNEDVLKSSELTARYSNYYTDQIKAEMMFNYSNQTIKEIFSLLKLVRADHFTEEKFITVFNAYTKLNSNFCTVFPDYMSLLDVLYSLDVIGWGEKVTYSFKEQLKMHWHYREVKAIDETYKLPWEQISQASGIRFFIHRGASRNILGQRF